MHSVLPRFPRILLASAFALSAMIAPAQYRPGNHKPGVAQQDASTGADTSARDPASGLPTGKRMHKPLTLTNRCDTHAQPTNGVASDPEEGGQIARTGGGSSDPEEGGQVTAADKAAKHNGKVNPGKMNFTHYYDTSSTTIMSAPAPSDCH